MRELDNINNVAIIGSGIMGSGIAQIALLSGYQKVALSDLSEKILKKARESIQFRIQSLDTEEKFSEFISNDYFMQNVMKNSTFEEIRKSFTSVGILADDFTIDEIMDRLICEVNLKKAVSDSDFIIEAVPENLDLRSCT